MKMLRNSWKKALAVAGLTAILAPVMAQEAVYHVDRVTTGVPIDGKWDKPQWKDADEVILTHYMGEIPPFKPIARAKMLYDDANLYLIFHVQDRYVSSVVEDYNGPVSRDACVEFFFSPDTQKPMHYFNLEINAGGTPLMRYNGEERKPFTNEDIAAFEIAHSLPKVVDPPINDSVTWTIECRIPLRILEKYGVVTLPEAGVTWRANFYKTASRSTNPHYITWSLVQNEKPNFHLPVYFGQLVFD